LLVNSSEVFSEGTPAVIARSLGLVVLGIAASLAWVGCRPAVPPPVGNQKGRPLVQKKAGPRVVRSKQVDDDFIRVRLLMLETVQKDLGLTVDQRGKIGDLVKVSERQSQEFWAKSREVLPPSRSFPTEEFEVREQEFRALCEDFKRKGKQLRTKALEMLTPTQSERLRQIQLQANIPAALARPEVIKALDISDEQRGKIRTLRDRVDEKTLAGWPDLRDLDPKECRQRLIQFMKECDKAQAEAKKPILDVLTPEQRAKFEELQGKKIEVTWPYDAWIAEDPWF
jgi:Spy/CpxP family protein refolding chaperone